MSTSSVITIKKLAQIAASFADQSDTDGMNSAGLLVSCLAENPQYIDPLLTGEKSVVDLYAAGVFGAEHGCLNWLNAQGELVEVNDLRRNLDLPVKVNFLGLIQGLNKVNPNIVKYERKLLEGEKVGACTGCRFRDDDTGQCRDITEKLSTKYGLDSCIGKNGERYIFTEVKHQLADVVRDLAARSKGVSA